MTRKKTTGKLATGYSAFHLYGGECLVLGDSILRNDGTECSGMKVEYFQGIRTEQLHRVIENRDRGSPGSVVIHVSTNDLN